MPIVAAALFIEEGTSAEKPNREAITPAPVERLPVPPPFKLDPPEPVDPPRVPVRELEEEYGNRP